MTIRGRKVCRGCVTVYPTFLIMLAILLIGRPVFAVAFMSSLLLFSIQLLRFIVHGSRWTIIFNLFTGSSLALAAFSALVCPPELRLYVYPFIVTVIVAFEFLKGRKMFRRCKECPSHESYPRCARVPMDAESRDFMGMDK